LKQEWEKICTNPSYKCFVVVNNNKIIATCILIIINTIIRNVDPYGLIEHVVTKKEFQGKGIGTMLIKFALDSAWKNNCYRILLLSKNEKK